MMSVIFTTIIQYTHLIYDKIGRHIIIYGAKPTLTRNYKDNLRSSVDSTNWLDFHLVSEGSILILVIPSSLSSAPN